MSALRLFADPVPRVVAGVDLRCADVVDVMATVRDARLVHIDPPWSYGSGGVFRGWQEGNAGAIEDHYESLSDAACAEHVDLAFDSAADDAYLLLWTTWPKLEEWQRVSASGRWAFKSGGVWTKSGRIGVGFHWRGDSEPILLYTKGRPKPLDRSVSNTWTSGRGAHSEKPTGFLRRLLAAFAAPDALVLDVYAGLAPMARACALEGRRYIGAEIDPERHAKALGLLAHELGRAA